MESAHEESPMINKIVFSMLMAAATSWAAAQAAPPSSETPVLTQADVDSWLDGFMPYAIDTADIAGAVIVVVKDGAVLTERGYGYSDVAARKPVDPRESLFRPGSTSKLFTWTAVMQLVEQGKIDLDRDVNDYLDFMIPPFQGQPVTTRQIMTHTAGFEEALSGLITSADSVPSLESVVKAWTPQRIFPPGVTPAYSNYATMLAGYIVQRISGEPYDDYIARHIFDPLGMTHSTFSEPLPAGLAPNMSKGYLLASQPAKPFEMITARPAGSLSTSGDDMARFMIAHLDEEHGVLLKPETAKQMHRTALTLLPPLNRMDLGFYEANLNGHSVISHGGDTQWFHSDLWLVLDQHVGLFVSLNSAGKDASSLTIRESLIGKFMDRYFPEPASLLPRFEARAAEAAALAGTYIVSRRSESGLRRALNFFGQLCVTTDAKGIHSSAFEFQGTNGAERDWVQIAPYLWKDRNSSERLAAQVRDGKVMRISVDSFSPFMVYDRVPWYQSTTWLRPAAIASVLVLLALVLSVPVGRMIRKYYAAGRKLKGSERAAYLTAALLSLGAIAILGAWLSVLLNLRFNPLGPAVQVLQIATIALLPVLCVASGWFEWMGIKARRGVLSALWRGIITLSSICILWVAIAFNLTHLGLNY
jgi:CubicO group peptidase (beta-lactamase class C family)